MAFLWRRPSQLRPGPAECGEAELQAAGAVDTEFWGSEGFRDSGRFTGNVAGDRWQRDTCYAVSPGSLNFVLRRVGGHGCGLRRGDVGFAFSAAGGAVWTQVEF